MGDDNKESYTEIENQEENEKTKFLEILEMLFYFIIVFLITFFIQRFLFVAVSVDGPSMEPTLRHSDRLILNKVTDPERFDIIVFPAPDDPEKQYIKRVIGVPGDHIVYEENELFINGEHINEPYVDQLEEIVPDWELYTMNFSLEGLTGENTVPEESYFVLGDNRINSKDSRSFGFIEGENVTGVANLRIWPLPDFGFVNEMTQKNIEDITLAIE